MLTVTVGFDGSGKSSTRRPLARRYSVMPSTSVAFTGFAPMAGAGALPFAAGAGRASPSPFLPRPGAGLAGAAGSTLGGAVGTDSGGGVPGFVPGPVVGSAGFFGSSAGRLCVAGAAGGGGGV